MRRKPRPAAEYRVDLRELRRTMAQFFEQQFHSLPSNGNGNLEAVVAWARNWPEQRDEYYRIIVRAIEHDYKLKHAQAVSVLAEALEMDERSVYRRLRRRPAKKRA